MKLTNIPKWLTTALVLTSLGLAACSSSDDDDNLPAPTDGDPDGTSMPADNIVSLALTLDSTSTVPPANVDGATGSGSLTVDTDTGAVVGSVTVSGTTGTPTVGHIHRGAVGEAGPIVITLEPSEDGFTFTAPDGAALDAVGIEDFNNGLLYINIHTEANAPGELRVQLVDASVPAPGSMTITFTNTAEFQPMTPPVAILHSTEIDFLEVGQPASGEVRMIAEDGVFMPLVNIASDRIGTTVTEVEVGFSNPDMPGPLLPGASATVNFDVESPDQVLTIVTMVVCTNDGFTGVDSMPLPEGDTTFTTPIYDAGSESNVLTLNYWVPACGGTGNITDQEGGAIGLHPGQSGSEAGLDGQNFDFEPGTEYLEVSIVRN